MAITILFSVLITITAPTPIITITAPTPTTITTTTTASPDGRCEHQRAHDARRQQTSGQTHHTLRVP
jgi:hypothetical protein